MTDGTPEDQKHVPLTYFVVGAFSLFLLFYNPLVDVAVTYNNEVATGALVLWGAMRSILGVMSVAKDADFQGTVLVASTTVSPGAVLNPIYDTIGRYVDVIFALVLWSNLLAILLPLIAKVGAVILSCGLFAMAGIGFLQRAKFPRTWLFAVSRAGVIVGIVLTLIVPAAYTLSFWTGEQVTRDAQDSAIEVWDQLTVQINEPENQENDVEELIPEVPEKGSEVEEPNVFSSALEGMSSAIDATKNVVGRSVETVGGIATSVRDQASGALKLAPIIVSSFPRLLNAAMQFLVALLLKIVVLPVLILGAAWLAIKWAAQTAKSLEIDNLQLK